MDRTVSVEYSLSLREGVLSVSADIEVEGTRHSVSRDVVVSELEEGAVSWSAEFLLPPT